MPANRPRASFEPISPTLDLAALVEDTPNFEFVDRISCDMIDGERMASFDLLVLKHVVLGGKPLVIDGYHERLDPWTFSAKWLQDNHGDKVENARNLSNQSNLPLTISHYLKNMSKLTDQYFERPGNYRDKNRQRIYLKDIDCPPVWFTKLQEQLPPHILYLNESCGDIDGPGAVDEPAPGGGKRRGKGIAPAGDLMSSLPGPMRAENLMCYIGHEGTYTPAHREMCASLGQNIMVEASGIVGGNGPEKPGSSIWFMTESKDRHMVSEYWLSTLGHDIEVESHFAQIAAWKAAPFTTYIVEQKPGDLILIPPLAPHQVWNRGTRTMKIAWNRTTIETLEFAMNEALPRARMVCRDEQYKNKAMIYYTLQKYSTLLEKSRDQQIIAPNPEVAASIRRAPQVRRLGKEFKRLFKLYKDLLLSEMFSRETPHEKNVQFLQFDGNVTCAYCRGNIFNRFLTCPACPLALGTEEQEPYDICMECYAMGRSCACVSKLRWAEQFKWKELVSKYEAWRKQHIELDGPGKQSPKSLQEEREILGKKTLAQVCQEQLRIRPWVDIDKPDLEKEDESDENDEIEIDENGMVKNAKTKKRRSEAWLKNHRACHVCCHRHEKWKMAECQCKRWWCYGSLFRAHDLMPQSVMEDSKWECPHCKMICSAGACRKDPRQSPYEPKGTLLGHDTKKVADARSVESLVDFGISNLNWLRETKGNPEDNIRLIRRQKEAHREKLNDTVEDNSDDDSHRTAAAHSPNSSMIDPRLSGDVNHDSRDQNSIQYHFEETELIDPALRENQTDPTNYVFGGIPNDYQPVTQVDFVAPSAVMYNQTNAEEGVEYEDDSSAFARKRNRSMFAPDQIRHSTDKRRRVDKNSPHAKPQAVKDATNKFRKEQERRSLEEARKNGRFIQVHAALRGRQKIVKLRVNKDALGKIYSKNIARASLANFGSDGADDVRTDKFSLESDIRSSPIVQVLVPELKQPSKFRYRTERDEDFGTRGDRRAIDGIPLSRKPAAPEYVEETLGSEDENGNRNNDAMSRTISVDEGRRLSSWQTQKHRGEDEDYPEELPSNFKDGKGWPQSNNDKNASNKVVPNHMAIDKLSKQSMPSRQLQDAPTALPSDTRDLKSNGHDKTVGEQSNLESLSASEDELPVKDVAMTTIPSAGPFHDHTKVITSTATSKIVTKESIFNSYGSSRGRVKMVSKTATLPYL